jgi:hypothetical protein
MERGKILPALCALALTAAHAQFVLSSGSSGEKPLAEINQPNCRNTVSPAC